MLKAKESHYQTLFDKRESTQAEPDWLTHERGLAIERFASQYETSLLDEYWRYTRPDFLKKTDFFLPELKNTHACVPEKQLVSGLSAHRLVFVDGAFSDALSVIDSLPEGAILTTLRDALENYLDLVAPVLKSAFFDPKNIFVDLNAAFFSDGLFLFLPKGVELAVPVQLVFLESESDQPQMINYRHVILTEEGAKATILEEYVGTQTQCHLTNTHMLISAKENANITRYKIQNENPKGFHISLCEAILHKDAFISTVSFSLGGALARDNLHCTLKGEGAHCELNGLFMLSDSQHNDTHIEIVHDAKNSRSEINYKGLASDRSKGVYNGKVLVSPGAEKTLSNQKSQNILLSNHAEIDSKPELEIYADDVKCAHGATVGSIDPNAIFYLRSRGIDAKKSNELLISAFASSFIDRITSPAIQHHLTAMVHAKLSQGMQ